jgi:UDP-galactopyranose mutase
MMQESIDNCDILIVGSGFFGSVIAERCANDLGLKVLLLESRDHIGGNCYSYNDEKTNINIHKYGPHIFHTSNEQVWKYINQFTNFNNYKHQCMSRIGKKTYSMPMNLATINQWFKWDLTPQQAKDFFKSYANAYPDPKNFEEQAKSLVGNDLYYAFYREYTIKQWDKDPTELSASIARRLPVRCNYNTRYYNDTWEGIPVDGYTPIFERMLKNKNIEVILNCDYFAIRDQIPNTKIVVYSGAIDRFFDYKYGVLNWRTCDFVLEHFDIEDYQGVTQINYPSLKIPYTRTIEFRHFHPEKNYTQQSTVVSFEFSKQAKENDVPYYPVNIANDKQIYSLYRADAQKLSNVVIGGRLGEYMYYDMHQVIGSALATYEKRIKNVHFNHS